MGELRPWHIVVILVVAFVLFGYKKLPDATRSLGRSLRILKTEVKTLHDDDEADKPAAASASAPAPSAPSVPVTPRAVEAPRAVVPEAAVPVAAPASAPAPVAPADSDLR